MAVKDINDFKEKAKKDINDIKNLAGDIVRIIGGGSENIKKELKKAVDSSVEKKKKSENRKKRCRPLSQRQSAQIKRRSLLRTAFRICSCGRMAFVR